MIIFWPIKSVGGGGVSTDPGIANVLLGISYEINGVPLVGTFVVPKPTCQVIGYADDNPVVGYIDNQQLIGYIEC